MVAMRLLIVEDEKPLADGLADGLRREGYLCDVVYDGATALVQVGANHYDVLILDRDIPQIRGDMVCQILRQQGSTIGILMLTAAGTLDDRVAGLDLGADDYLAKPFAYVELLARIRALSRRSAAEKVPTILTVGKLRLDTVRRVVEENGIPLRLSPKEYGILAALLTAQGAWVSADELLDEVWAEATDRTRAVVKTTMYTLRKKLKEPWLIDSATEFGYRIEVPENA